MFFIGDIHGQFQKYHDVIQNMDCSLQIGDFGIFYEKDLVNPVIKTEPQHHKVFRGNHDNPSLFKQLPNNLGDYAYNGEIFHMAGGFSIDYRSRLQGVSWWDDEELGWNELQKAIELYKASKPKIMVSHECPSVIKPAALAAGGFHGKATITSRTENALQAMFEIHQPEIWIFGHYHNRIDERIGNTRFVGLADSRKPTHEMIFELPALKW